MCSPCGPAEIKCAPQGARQPALRGQDPGRRSVRPPPPPAIPPWSICWLTWVGVKAEPHRSLWETGDLLAFLQCRGRKCPGASEEDRRGERPGSPLDPCVVCTSSQIYNLETTGSCESVHVFFRLWGDLLSFWLVLGNIVSLSREMMSSRAAAF